MAASVISGVKRVTAISRLVPNISTRGISARASGSIAGVSATITGVKTFKQDPDHGPERLEKRIDGHQ